MVSFGVLSDPETPNRIITPEGKISTVIDNEKIFEVDTIKDFKTKNGKRIFLVSWKGYDSSEDTWEPEENIYFDPTESMPIIEAIKQKKAEQKKQKRNVKNLKKPDNNIQICKESLETLSSELENETCDKFEKQLINISDVGQICSGEEKNLVSNSKKSHMGMESEEFPILASKIQTSDIIQKSGISDKKKNFDWNSFKSNNKIEKMKHLKETIKSSLKFKDNWKKNSIISPISIADEYKKEKTSTVKIFNRDFRKTGLEDYKIPKLGTAGKRRDSASQISSDYKNLFMPKNLTNKKPPPVSPLFKSPIKKDLWSLLTLENVIQPIEPGSKSEMKNLYGERREYNKYFFMGTSFDISKEPDEFELLTNPEHNPIIIPLELTFEEVIEEAPSETLQELQTPDMTKEFIIPSIVVQAPEVYENGSKFDQISSIIKNTHGDLKKPMINENIDADDIGDTIISMACLSTTQNSVNEIFKNEPTDIEIKNVEVVIEKISPDTKVAFEFLEKVLKKVNQEAPIKLDISTDDTPLSLSISDEIIDIPDTPASPDPEPIEEDVDEHFEAPSIVFPTRGRSRFDVEEDGRPKVETAIPPPTIVDFGWMEREQEEKFSKLINFLASGDDKVVKSANVDKSTNGHKNDKYCEWKRDRSQTMPYDQRLKKSSTKNLYKYTSDNRIYEPHKKRYKPKLRSPSRSSSTSSIKWNLCIDD